MQFSVTLRTSLLALALAATPALATDAAKTSAPVTDGPRVTVETAQRKSLTQHVIVTGTLVPRDEILVGPEIDGFRIVEILAEDGDKVAKGQVLARLNRDTLDAILAQNDAALARVEAAIAQAGSSIAQAEAALTQSRLALGRTSQLSKNGYAAQATLDTQTQDERANRARLDAARQGLTSAQAEKANVEAQRRELKLRLERTDVRAPEAGIIMRRTARIGAVASMAAEPLFRLIAKGEVELEAELTETRMNDVKVGNPTAITVGDLKAQGVVRLVSSEIDKVARLGKIRIAVSNDGSLKVGAFARGVIDTKSATGVAVPLSAVLYSTDGPFVQVVKDKHIVSTPVKIGIVSEQFVQVISGVDEGATYVVKAGAFLRSGDAVQPVTAGGTAAVGG